MQTASPPSAPDAAHYPDVGAILHDGGVTYRIWAPDHRSAKVHIGEPGKARRVLSLDREEDSDYFSIIDPDGRAGDLYQFSIDQGPLIPDFASRHQPQGVLGPSQVVDTNSYEWQEEDWKRPAWKGQVIYECHVGTFTPEGTYLAMIAKLDHLVSLGITAVELMPLAECAGERNWGYDGVMLFAPAHPYGTPRDLQALVDACHQRGLAVVLDVVFNHLGPEGNFSHHYSGYFFYQGKNTQWGQSFNLDGPKAGAVRALLRENIRYWLEEFRFDGFRMDATHAVHDSSTIHLLAEIAEIVHEHSGFIVAEDERNAREILEPRDQKGWGFDAAWADDFHHVTRISQTHEHQAYYGMFKGTTEEIGRLLQLGWLYCGQANPLTGKARGTPCDDFAPERFVYCISNHDQVGNRLIGDRLHHKIDPAGYRALSLLLCLVPYTPMLFMGQEWGASSPFLYFTDMPDELGRKIGEGRKRELLQTKFATSEEELTRMPDPQNLQTFLDSKLKWQEISEKEHHRMLDLYRAGLKLRRELFGRSNPSRDQWKVEAGKDHVLLRYRLNGREVDVQFHLQTPTMPRMKDSVMLLRSNAPAFTDEDNERPETIVTAKG